MIHHVYANRTNIGDWASALGIQRLLDRPCREFFCDEPFVAATIRKLSKAAPDDVVIVGGGGLLMKYFEPLWHGLLTVTSKAPVYLWGIGACDMKAEATLPDRQLVRSVAANAAGVWVRDELSRDFLNLEGLPPPVLCPSLAFLADAPPGRGILHVDNYDTAGAEAFAIMDECARDFARCGDVPYRRTNNRIEGRPALAKLDAILDLYHQSEIVLSSGLHGCIFAAALGRRIVAVSGDRKIEGFMEAIGLGDWVVSHDAIGDLPRLLERAREQPDVSGRVAEAVRQNQSIAEQISAALLTGQDR